MGEAQGGKVNLAFVAMIVAVATNDGDGGLKRVPGD